MMDDMGDDSATTWPLGVALERHRTERGLAKREAARRAGLSDTAWRTLEQGYELKGGHRFEASPRAETVVKAAGAVGLAAERALELAGIPLADYREPEAPDLSAVSDDQLLDEVRRRMADGVSTLPSKAERDATPERYMTAKTARRRRA